MSRHQRLTAHESPPRERRTPETVTPRVDAWLGVLGRIARRQATQGAPKP